MHTNPEEVDKETNKPRRTKRNHESLGTQNKTVIKKKPRRTKRNHEPLGTQNKTEIGNPKNRVKCTTCSNGVVPGGGKEGYGVMKTHSLLAATEDDWLGSTFFHPGSPRGRRRMNRLRSRWRWRICVSQMVRRETKKK